jgi:FKBP-type peptidyl-prolyl cis-trans isomerase
MTGNLLRWIGLATVLSSWAPCVASASQEAGSATVASGGHITVSFKLDPRLSGPTYGGERWVSPPTYSGATAQDKVEARAEAIDANGRPVHFELKWIPANPRMVTISPGQGKRVVIAVKRAGESKLKVASQDSSKELLIKAKRTGKAIQIEIVQLGAGPAPRGATGAGTQAAPAPWTSSPLASPPREGLAEANEKAGEAFRAQNALKKGVVTLPSGVQYQILKKGQGRTPIASDTVRFHYRGTFVDGAEFASSHRRGGPATVKLTRAIPGFREALKRMPVGSRWQIVVPPRLAYGPRGTIGKRRPGPQIGPNATLVFDVELLAISASPAKATGGTPTVATAAPKERAKGR